MRKTVEGSQATCPRTYYKKCLESGLCSGCFDSRARGLNWCTPLYTCCAPRDHGHCEACPLCASRVWIRDETGRKQTRKRIPASQWLTELQEAPGSLRLGNQHKLSSLNSRGGGLQEGLWALHLTSPPSTASFLVISPCRDCTPSVDKQRRRKIHCLFLPLPPYSPFKANCKEQLCAGQALQCHHSTGPWAT